MSLFTLLLAGCGKPAILRDDAPSTRYHCAQFDGRPRCYYQIDPVDQEPKATLMVLHPAFTSPARIERLVEMAPLAIRRGYRIIYPEGIDGHWNDGRGAGRTETVRQNIDDVNFLTLITGETRLAGKPYYLLGMSNGGMMAMRLVCQSQERFDGMATVASNLPAGLPENCLNITPLPVWLWFGSEDDVIPPAGGAIYGNAEAWGVVASARETIDFWAWYNKAHRQSSLDALGAFADLPDTLSQLEVQHYTGAAPVQVTTALGAGHTWPGEPGFFAFITLRGAVNREVDGTQAVLDWFDGLSVNP